MLTSFEPVVEAWLRIECFADGWRYDFRHRHHAGLFCDCPTQVFDRLTHSELLDVVLVTLDRLNDPRTTTISIGPEADDL